MVECWVNLLAKVTLYPCKQPVTTSIMNEFPKQPRWQYTHANSMDETLRWILCKQGLVITLGHPMFYSMSLLVNNLIMACCLIFQKCFLCPYQNVEPSFSNYYSFVFINPKNNILCFLKQVNTTFSFQFQQILVWKTIKNVIEECAHWKQILFLLAIEFSFQYWSAAF